MNIEENNEYDYEWTGLNPHISKYILDNGPNPLEHRLEEEMIYPGAREFAVMRNTNYMYFTAKVILDMELMPFQQVLLDMFWRHSFPMLIGSRGLGKSSIAAVYSLLRALFHPGSKIVVCGSAFRQSKFIFDYIEAIWNKAPVLQSLCDSKSGPRRSQDMYQFHINDSIIYTIPIGTGDKIRGLRGNVVIADEFNAINTQIYEVVIKNFGAVEQNPVGSVKRQARLKSMERRGIDIPDELRNDGFKNQSIIMGTMGFEFEPLYEYWQKYKTIIDNKGVMPDGSQMKAWREFAIMRMPYELIPYGFMSEDTIEAARATMHTAYYNSEFGCVPVKDTVGFFKRTTIEACVAKPSNIEDSARWPSWCPSVFDARLKGQDKVEYVMGIDPAAEDDNFAIVILEIHPEHSRVVYCWTVNKKQLGDQVKNYYAYCARKVRSLMKSFNITRIGIDAMGGGYSLAEALQDEDKLKAGERPLWPVIDPDKKQDTDGYAGDHILHMVQFASAEWTATNNHGMLKDFQSKTLLFPNFNTVLLGLGPEEDKALGIVKSIYSDSMEDCITEIEELKKELTIIIHSKTAHRERWDTPEIKDAENKKTNLKKDRYSALLIANSIAREYSRNVPITQPTSVGGRVGHTKEVHDEPMYVGPEHLIKGMHPGIFRAITR